MCYNFISDIGIISVLGKIIMSNEWEKLREIVLQVNQKSPSWKSDLRSILQIINYANTNHLQDTGVNEIEITKLRTIVKEANIALYYHDLERLSTLFDWAKNMTIIELRQAVGSNRPKIIFVEKSQDLEGEFLLLKLTPDQFEKIEKSTRLIFKFEMK